MRAIFSRPLVSRRHQPMDEWHAELARLAAACPARLRRLHPDPCPLCADTLREVLLAAMLEDTAPLPLLEGLIDRLERTAA